MRINRVAVMLCNIREGARCSDQMQKPLRDDPDRNRPSPSSEGVLAEWQLQASSTPRCCHESINAKYVSHDRHIGKHRLAADCCLPQHGRHIVRLLPAVGFKG